MRLNPHRCIIYIYFLLLITLTMIVSSCSDNLVLMHPAGEIGLEERSLILIACGLMLIIVLPVIFMTFYFSIKYRISNTNDVEYQPNWSNSKKIECVVWFVPIIIIIFLSILTWKSTHKLDPKKPIISSMITYQPIVVHVVALDWKWLFIYPQQNIATINELVFPAYTPITFYVTSNSVMNSFFIPQLGGQIYAMAGMRTELNLIANTPGKYKGISSNFSGKGFSGMKFTVFATNTDIEFNQWITQVQKSPFQIHDMSIYKKLAQPTEYDPVIYFSKVTPDLFYKIIDQFSNQKCT